MKKLLAILVVFTLVVGAVSAVDLGGTVFGHVNLLEGSTADGSEVIASGGMDRLRIDGGGTAGDSFGGYLRLNGGDFSGNAWWKPLDAFKLTIGSNPDGYWGKEGNTGWSFNQMPYDSGIAINSGIWYGDGWGSSVYGGYAGYHNRYVFFGGFGDNGALLEITPVDIFGVNIAIPYMAGGTAKDVYKSLIAQVNLNLDFGNIAVTFNGGDSAGGEGAGGAIFAYFGGSFGDLGIDFGFSFHLPGDNDVSQPLGVGIGAKYATDTFGIKFKTIATLAGDNEVTVIKVDLLPYYAISDNISAFLNAGLGMTMPSVGDSVVGWFANPYLRVGAEWGPTFYFGIQVSSDGGDDINFAVPISLMVSF